MKTQGEGDIPQWFRDIQGFNANPPMPLPTAPRRTRALTSYSVGQTKTFWCNLPITEVSQNTWEMGYVEKQATLRAQGTYGNVWVLDDDFTASSSSPADKKITGEQAQALADKFDLIYPVETGLLGYEYGGDPDDAVSYGGVDGDPRVQILVYDFFPVSSDLYSSTADFFFSGDYYPSLRRGQETNQAEIFYINSYWFDKEADMTSSTLVHERNSVSSAFSVVKFLLQGYQAP